MQAAARQVYLEFIAQAVASHAVWSLCCHRDLVVLTGAHAGFFPLWPDAESAHFFSTRLWPDLAPTELPLKLVLRAHLPALARAAIPVGVGVAPHPDAIVLRANRLRRDLVVARRVARTRALH